MSGTLVGEGNEAGGVERCIHLASAASVVPSVRASGVVTRWRGAPSPMCGGGCGAACAAWESGVSVGGGGCGCRRGGEQQVQRRRRRYRC